MHEGILYLFRVVRGLDWIVSEACVLHSAKNTNRCFGHYANSGTVVVDTASLAEQSIFIKVGELWHFTFWHPHETPSKH